MKNKLFSSLLGIIIGCVVGVYSYAAAGPSSREETIDKSLQRIAVMKALRKQIVEKALHRVEFSMDYGFGVQGEQSFTRTMLEYDGADRVATEREVSFPHRGSVLRFKGEGRVLPNIYLGGQYIVGLSDDEKAIDVSRYLATSGAKSWNNYTGDIDMQQFDLNLYVRLFNADHLRDLTESDLSTLYYKMVLSPDEVKLSNYILDRISVDVCLGYKYYNSKYDMTEGVRAIPTGQFYEVTYKGPRLGLRGETVWGPLTARISLAYLWLTTEADGWWSQEAWSFSQEGSRGRGVEFEIEGMYSFTSSFSAGLGFALAEYQQSKAVETGSYYGTPYPQGPQGTLRGASVRDIKSVTYYPFLKARLVW